MEEKIRLNKYISESGALSRRKADEAIADGRVMINGKVAVMGDKVGEDDLVLLDGKLLTPAKKKVILVYNKPLGKVCTAKEADKDSLFRSFDYPVMLSYVGRLDKDSQGLLLLTNDGDLSNMIQKSRYNHEKEYVVRVDKEITEDFIKGMREGVSILDTITKKCKVEKQGRNSFRIILTQGLNRQIRRMCEYFGYRVTYLKRIREINIHLGDLKPGEYREITSAEEKELRRLVSGQVTKNERSY